MEQFKTFALGALKMLTLMALIITCINAIVVGPGFIRAVGIISLIAVGHEAYLIIRDTRNN